MEPLAAFRSEQWDAVEAVIGHRRVLTFDIKTPREWKKCIVWGTEDGRLFQTSASNSFSEPIAELILERCKAIDSLQLPPAKVAVMDTVYAPVSSFEATVIAPPEIAQFDHLRENIRTRMHLVAPAFRSEFRDGMSAKEFRHQLVRKDGWRVPIFRWDRLEKTAPS